MGILSIITEQALVGEFGAEEYKLITSTYTSEIFEGNWEHAWIHILMWDTIPRVFTDLK